MKIHYPITPEDKAIFQKAMKDVKPIQTKNLTIEKYLGKNNRLVKGRTMRQPMLFKSTEKHLPEIAAEHCSVATKHFHTENRLFAEIKSEDKLFFAHPSLPLKTTKRLKKGEIPIKSCLDLHGLTHEQAEDALENFLRTAQESGIRHAQIISGKSGQFPILKNLVYQTLTHHPMILAFCSCQPKHGGAGAVYVLLKKYRA